MADSDGRLSCFLVGLGMGIVVGVLYAPRAGEETRELLTHKADEGRDFVKRRGRELRDQADDYIAKGKETVERQKGTSPGRRWMPVSEPTAMPANLPVPRTEAGLRWKLPVG